METHFNMRSLLLFDCFFKKRKSVKTIKNFTNCNIYNPNTTPIMMQEETNSNCNIQALKSRG